MEVNAEKSFAKYSKLAKDIRKKDNQTQESMDTQKAEKLVLTWFENNNSPKAKDTQGKIGLKTLVGLSFVFLMIVTGLVVGLIVMDTKIKKLEYKNENLEHQNENLVQNLKDQENISQGLKAQYQNLSKNFENMTNALVLSEIEIGDLKEEIQNLIDQNQKLIDDFESKHQSLEHYQNLHQNCSKEKEFSTALIEDLKLQNQNLTKDLEKMDSAKKSLVDSIPDGTKDQLLVKASKTGNIDQVRLLLDLGVDVNAINDQHKSSLYYASEKGHLEIVILLLQHGADSNASDYQSKTPLHKAAQNGNLEIAELLLKNKADVNSKDANGDTPLHYASKSGDLEVAELLLQNGADVSACNSYHQQTPLHLAAINGHPKVVEVLLKHGARKDVKDDFGDTPLMDAKYYKRGDYQEVIALLQDS